MKKRCKFIVLLCLMAMLPLAAHGERFFNTWEASYVLGTPGPTASWLNYKSTIGPGVAMHNAKLTIGPSIENGFYYDIDFETPISENDLEAVETAGNKGEEPHKAGNGAVEGIQKRKFQ